MLVLVLVLVLVLYLVLTLVSVVVVVVVVVVFVLAPRGELDSELYQVQHPSLASLSSPSAYMQAASLYRDRYYTADRTDTVRLSGDVCSMEELMVDDELK